jgi:secreted PhoX family phosphatase
VVEIDPKTGKGKKLTAMGRFAHECATVRELPDGRCVVYTGDDKNDEHIYKFIASEKGSLEKGELFVANIDEGKWISLDINKQPKLKAHFDDQTEVLIYAREAAKMVGATPCNRPEDFEIHPTTGDVYLTLTNNKPKGDFHGQIMKIMEEGNNPESMSFKAETFVAGGEQTGFSCPDNLAFDKNGNLWMVTDISGSSLGKKQYSSFGNNGLFYIPLQGPKAGIPIQVGSAPHAAELTGLCFAPDNQTLFLSVQHPGERSKSLKELKSNWPEGGNAIPKPSVVQIQGPLLEKLLS